MTLDAHTAHYVVSLLTLYSRTEVSHADTRPGQCWVGLAGLLARAAEARTPIERDAILRRLIDVDYHIAMGGRAYGTLATNLTGPRVVAEGCAASL